MAAATPGRTVRDYVVLQEYGLIDLIESIIGTDVEGRVDADAFEKLQAFEEMLYVKVATIEARNAPAAFRQARGHLRRPADQAIGETVVVQAVTVPESQWAAEGLPLTLSVDVGVG